MGQAWPVVAAAGVIVPYWHDQRNVHYVVNAPPSQMDTLSQEAMRAAFPDANDQDLQLLRAITAWHASRT